MADVSMYGNKLKDSIAYQMFGSVPVDGSLKYICSWSGGKDSTASIILAHLHNEPLDLILMAEVMYDNKRNISGENPEHIKWVREYAKLLFESWGYRVEIVRADSDYLTEFNRVMQRAKNKENVGKCIGFPLSGLCFIKRDLKVKPIKDFLKDYTDRIEYIGLAIDETKRLDNLHNRKNEISLLEKYNYTEDMARELCLEYGLLSPSYKYTKRNGCFFCANAKLAEHRAFREKYPQIWQEFIELEKRTDIAYKKWNIYGETLAEREETLRNEDAQMNIFDFIGKE